METVKERRSSVRTTRLCTDNEETLITSKSRERERES
jgi:hypothetical protein